MAYTEDDLKKELETQEFITLLQKKQTLIKVWMM